MSESQIQKMRALILKHAPTIAPGFPSNGFSNSVARATDEELLRGCLKLIVSFGLWMQDFIEGKSVVLLSRGTSTEKNVDTSDYLKKLLDESGGRILNEIEQMTFRQERSNRSADARLLALNLFDLRMCIASARLAEVKLGPDMVDESVPPKDYDYLIHPQAEAIVKQMLSLD